MPNLPKPTTKAPWLGLPIDVSDRNGNPIHIGDVLHFDPAEWGSDDEYFCVFGRMGDLRLAKAERPDPYAQLVRLERDMGHTFRQGFQLADLDTAFDDGLAGPP